MARFVITECVVNGQRVGRVAPPPYNSRRLLSTVVQPIRALVKELDPDELRGHTSCALCPGYLPPAALDGPLCTWGRSNPAGEPLCYGGTELPTARFVAEQYIGVLQMREGS